jgi:hypothetical protein
MGVAVKVMRCVYAGVQGCSAGRSRAFLVVNIAVVELTFVTFGSDEIGSFFGIDSRWSRTAMVDSDSPIHSKIAVEGRGGRGASRSERFLI